MTMAEDLRAGMNRLPQQGRLAWIGLSPGPREPIRTVDNVEVRVGTGLEGDRHALRGSGKRQVTLIQADATRPPPANAAANIAFLDAPYGSGLAGPALAALARGGWLASGALVVGERAAKESDEASPPEGFEILEARRYGAARFSFLRFVGV